jgi:hypothetical protein
MAKLRHGIQRRTVVSYYMTYEAAFLQLLLVLEL